MAEAVVSPAAQAEQEMQERAERLLAPWLDKLKKIDAQAETDWARLARLYDELESVYHNCIGKSGTRRSELRTAALEELQINGRAREAFEDALRTFNADQVAGPLPGSFPQLLSKLGQNAGHIARTVQRVFREDGPAASTGWGETNATYRAEGR